MPSKRTIYIVAFVLVTIVASTTFAAYRFQPQLAPRLEEPKLSGGLRVEDLFDDSAVSDAAGGGFRPQFEPQVEIPKIPDGIRVDGQLDDPAWRRAAEITNFAETTPGDQVKPAVKTTAWIAYDDNNLYVSCVCYDNPEEIRATYCDRDQLTGNDVIILLIDTYGEASWAYNLYVNPLGVQTDAMWRPLGSDFGYNVVY
ncbi:MAG: hypothetical protein JSU74_00960, partial [Candidatus Zixiibacteriota bacterium]